MHVFVPALRLLHRIARPLTRLHPWMLVAVLLAMAGPAYADVSDLLMKPKVPLSQMLGIDPMLLFGSVMGIVAASFIYLSANWLIIRDRSQLFLVLMLLSLILHLVLGGNFVGVLAANPLGNLFIQHTTLLLFYLFSCLFTAQYLELDTNQSPYRYMFYMLAGICALSAGLALVDIKFVASIMSSISGAVLGTLTVSGVLAYFYRRSGGISLILAFGALLAGQLPGIINLDMPITGTDLALLSYALCAMLFSVATAFQFARKQEKKEFELARSNQRFQMAALGSHEGLYEWDMVKQEGYFSERLCKILGYDPGKIKHDVLQRWLKNIHPSDRAATRRAFFKFLGDKNQRTLRLEYRIRRMDGKTAWVTTTAVAQRERDTRKVTRLVGSVGDVTEKKRSEEQLKASERRFRGIAAAHPVPVIITTLPEGEIVYASPGAEKTLGFAIKDLLGMKLEYFLADRDVRGMLNRDLKLAGRVDIPECKFRRGDQTLFPAAVSARMIDYEKRPCAVLGIYDTSERMVAEARMREAEAALVQSEKLAALGGLLAGVAHELNNPLSVIVGQATLMREAAKDDKTGQRADKIQKAGERCSRIVRSFLALARRKPNEKVSTQLNEIIENSLELLAFQLREGNIELIKKMGPTLPPVMADGDQLTQVITNLIINARQALQDKAGPRTVTIETWQGAGLESGAIFTAITDNGTGVPHDLKLRVFEPFFTTKPSGAGTGVGLSLCHSIIESHGGRIWVEDAAKGGARFIFSLPAAIAVAAGDAAPKKEEAAPDYKIPPQRVLIVDDEVELAQTLADILAPDGHTTELAENGKEALKLLEANDFDLIISDLRMPVMDGPSMYRSLEKSRSRYLQRIIFVTGDTLSIPIREFIDHYAIEVIEKPYTPHDVRQAIAAMVRELPKPATHGSNSAAMNIQ